MSTLDTIGFIGLGTMGRAMALNLVRSGFQVKGYDQLGSAIQAVAAEGAVAAESPADAASGAQLVITMLPNVPDVESVLTGVGGIMSAPGEGRRLMNSSTIDPAATKRLSQLVETNGWRYLDCPVGRTAADAEQGRSLFMLGGEAEDKAFVRPALEAMGDTIIDCGEVGHAMTIKIANNYLSTVAAVVTAEALHLVKAGGVSTDAALEVINNTIAMNGHTKINFTKKVLAGDVTPGFAINHAAKDLGIATGAMEREGIPCFVGAAALEAYIEARKDDRGDNDWSDIYNLVGEMWQSKKA